MNTSARTPSEHWAQTGERGASIGMRSVLWVMRTFGIATARIFLYPILAYFFATGSKARNASLQYLKRVDQYFGSRSPFTHPPGLWHSWRHFVSFGQSALDKVAAWMGKIPRSSVDFPNRDLFLDLIAQNQGAILLGSHIGNLEMIRAIAHNAVPVRLNVMVHTHHAAKFNDLLRKVNPDVQVHLIQVSEVGADTAIMLNERIEQGEFVVIVGDRTSISLSGRETYVDFLGYSAPFADGPLILASLMKCPVYTLFCVKNDRGYFVDFQHFADRIVLARSHRTEALAKYHRKFAERMEAMCKLAPLQWFNFYDFWRGQSSTPENTLKHQETSSQ